MRPPHMRARRVLWQVHHHLDHVGSLPPRRLDLPELPHRRLDLIDPLDLLGLPHTHLDLLVDLPPPQDLLLKSLDICRRSCWLRYGQLP